jgi:hypothetical protein
MWQVKRRTNRVLFLAGAGVLLGLGHASYEALLLSCLVNTEDWSVQIMELYLHAPYTH